MKIPIAFVHGEENETWLPQSTRDTFDLLVKTNGPDLYSRYLIPHYGHIDCIFGQNAHRDVYPVILKHLEADTVDKEPGASRHGVTCPSLLPTCFLS